MSNHVPGAVTGGKRDIDCPRCHETALDTKTVMAITIDRCPDCNGTWYDDGELKGVLGPHYDYDSLMRNMDLGTSELACPVCRELMTALEYRARRFTVTIDHCTTCKGFWLDKGELGQIRLVEADALRRQPSALRPRPLLPPPKPGFKTDDTALKHYQSFDHKQAAEYASIGVPVYLFCLFSQLPVEVFNPRKRFPSLLLAIIAVNFGVFGLQRSMPANMVEPFIHMFGKVPEQALTLAGCYQLITAGFLHADWWHLIGNMYILWIFGDNVIDVLYDHGERKGPLMFLFFYTVVLIISGITACMVYFEFKVIIGASGAISGVMAAYWRLFPRSACTRSSSRSSIRSRSPCGSTLVSGS